MIHEKIQNTLLSPPVHHEKSLYFDIADFKEYCDRLKTINMDLLVNTSSINAINYIVLEEDTSQEIMVLLFTMHFLSGTDHSMQSPTIFEQRLNWTKLTERHQDRDVFCHHIHMSVASFDKLLGFLSNTWSEHPSCV
jgi:hypothetical protein